jgi:hypothetical protein
MLTLNRRDFFKIGALFYLSASLEKALGNSSSEKVIFTGEIENKLFESDPKYYTLSLNLDNFKFDKAPSPLNCHSFVQHPFKKKQIVGIEKWGYGLGIFDGDSLRLIKHIKVDPPFQFVGHGEFALDGSLLYVSVSEYNDPYVNSVGRGLIFVYETKNYSLVEKFQTYGFEPHQISFFAGGKYLLVLNPGFGKFFNPPFLKDRKGPIMDFYPSITVVETNTKALIKKVLFQDKEITMAHLTKINEDTIFLVGGKKLPKNKWENKAFIFTLEEGLKPYPTSGEGMESTPLLTAAYSPKNDVIAATSPRSNSLLVWKNGSLATLDLKGPDGVNVSKDHKFFVITQKNLISILDIDSSKIINQRKLPHFTSRHGHSLII